ncbi:MAG: ATP-binding protein [Anaerolineae bacterium]|nr:ATP-binding protein [Anaerolineae bacterium]
MQFDKDFAVTDFGDHQQTLTARLLQISIYTSASGSVLSLFISFPIAYGPLTFLSVCLLTGTLVAYILLRSAKLRLASLTLLYTLLVPYVIYLGIADGIHDSIIGLIFVLILAAAMLLHKRDFYTYAGLVFLSLQGLILGETLGILNNNMSNFTTYLDMLTWGTLIAAMIALSNMFSLIIRNSLAQLNQTNSQLQDEIFVRKKAEETLRIYSDNLEDRVAQRTQELKNAQGKLMRQERLAAIGELAGSVGHELRNPLGTISNALYLLRMTLNGSEQNTQDLLEIIGDAINKSSKIISDLLDYARVHSVNPQIFTVESLVQLTMTNTEIPDNITAQVEIPNDLPPLTIDVQQMEQVFSNLVTNACQAMPEGGLLTITSDTTTTPRDTPSPEADTESERWIQITVRDTGTGISPEHIQKIFEPLFTTKPSGIGLGLALSKKLVEANGGQIILSSELDKGTGFTVLLPVYEDNS